tara:strand:+ start:18 stop:1115 length:1098 start_codon:yes stop_codon:yes gene_type:complete
MIESIKILPNYLYIKFKNEIDDNFPNIWLRDHAKDEENWDYRSNQRKTYTASLSSKLFIKDACVIDNGRNINVLWSDSKKFIKYSAEFLLNNSFKKSTKIQNHTLWNKNERSKNIFLKYDNILSDDGFKSFLKNLYTFGFCVITDCKTEIKTVENIANKIGYVRQSIFGGLWEFESNEDMADSAYTQEELRPHTDSTYSNDAPGLQLLLCCDYKAIGGDSIMVDGFKIANKIKEEDKKVFDILSNIEVPGKYVGDGVILEAKRPILKLNSNKELIQVSFNNYDRAEFRLENELMINFYKAIKKFDSLVNDSAFQWRHTLKPGELLIFNNWRVLHGRGSFQGKRKMAGCYINMEDFESICKVNGLY